MSIENQTPAATGSSADDALEVQYCWTHSPQQLHSWLQESMTQGTMLPYQQYAKTTNCP
jgi:hypothetical protein